LSLERDTRVVTSPTKIEDSALVRRLEEENGQLKIVVDILNAEINNLKRKSQAIQNSEAKEEDQNANSLLKSISFSNENRNKFESNKKKEAYSKIRIEDIYEDEVSDDTDTIERLTELVNEYREQLEQRDKQISQLNKVLGSYKQTIEKLELEGRSRSGSSSELRDRSKQAADMQALNMNVYVSNILRKLSIA
jgi:prefoldin subunit 5